MAPRHGGGAAQRLEWELPNGPRDKMKRYEKFADEIAGLIRSGVLAPGQKVPSVRHASRTYGVSASTVFQAYYLLEDRGLIVARARSGYFVREHVQRALAEPEIARHDAQTTEVAVSELVFWVLSSIKDPDTVPFGSAFPAPELFPLPRLARSMAHAVRENRPHRCNGDLALHVLEVMEAFETSSKSGASVAITTPAERPAPLSQSLVDGRLG